MSKLFGALGGEKKERYQYCLAHSFAVSRDTYARSRGQARLRDRSDGENGEHKVLRGRALRTLPVLGAMVATPREQMQAGLSVAAQIMHRRHSTSAGEMSSDDEEPEGSNELAERWNNNVAGMSFRQRSLLEGILSKSPTLHKVADSSSPVPPIPSFPPTVAQPRWPHPHAAEPLQAEPK